MEKDIVWKNLEGFSRERGNESTKVEILSHFVDFWGTSNFWFIFACYPNVFKILWFKLSVFPRKAQKTKVSSLRRYS